MTEELVFSLYLILINLSSHTWLVAPTRDSLFTKLLVHQTFTEDFVQSTVQT